MTATKEKRKPARSAAEMRTVHIKKDVLKYADGSCQIDCGDTKVICSATIEESVPPFLRGSGKGWVTAEYGMLPASCNERIARERNKISGRTQEIQRLIGRALRSVTDLTLLGERSIMIDADVLQGDGGTRTAAITGCFVALADAIQKLLDAGKIRKNPLKDYVAAVSVGIVDGKPILDLEYTQDSNADVDMNIVMTGDGRLVEVQGTAEKVPFDEKQLMALIGLAKKGISKLVDYQKQMVKI